MSKVVTPVKIVRSSVDDFCRVCNTSLIIYGYGKLNLFQGENAKKQNIVARLSAVLGFPVCKQSDASSRLCMKCRRELEKLENLNGAMENFRYEAQQTLQMQRELVENGMQTRTKRCHGNSPRSPIANKAAPKSPLRPAGRRQILTPVNNQNPLSELPRHDDLIVPVKPKKVTSSVEVKVKFPSKTIYKEFTDEVNSSIVRNMVCGTSANVANAVWSSQELKTCILTNVVRDIEGECSRLCSRKDPSILTNTSPDDVISLKDSHIVNELLERAPTFHRCLLAAASSKPKLRKDVSEQQKRKTTAAISMASSVLLRCHNPAMSANAYRLSVLLWHGGAQKQLYKRCSRWGICMSHSRLLKKIDAFGENFDNLVKEWKGSIEHGCKRQSVLSTILEVVEEAEMETVPDGLETINVAGLGLSFPAPRLLASCVDDMHYSSNSSSNDILDIGQEIGNSLSIGNIKDRVKLRLGSRFDEKAFDFVIGEINKSSCGNLSSRILKEFGKHLQMAHPAPYQITGDNLDLMMKVKHMSSTNKNKSIHWFNLNAVQNRIAANHLANEKPIQSVSNLENVDFLPSAEENERYLHDVTALVTKVVVKDIPAFATFKDVVVHHIPHKYSDVMKEKSVQLPLGLLFKNENVNADMIDILHELHDKYLPVEKEIVNGEEVVTILERIFFGGDQLTDERAWNCKDARSDGDTSFERLEGVISKVEDWHAIRILYQILYDVFFKSSSGIDIGTMCANMNIINNCNAKTANVLDNFNQCKDFVNLETDALITVAAMTYFGMESFDDKAENIIPPGIMESSKDKRRIWLHSHIRSMLSRFVMKDQSSEHEHLREHVAEANRPKEPVVYACRICGKPYKYAKSRENHETRMHPGSSVNLSENEKPDYSDNTGSECEHKEKPRDDIYRYATLRLCMGLFLRNFDDAVKEGDGERITRCWKFAMLVYKARNHNKYALAALRLQAFIMALLSPREAESLKWNRTVNNKGGPGNNISMDIRMEHLIHLTKELLKHLGPNITEDAAKRCSKSISHVEQLINTLDKDLIVETPGGHHKVQKRESDFKCLVDELYLKGKVFRLNPGPTREYCVFAKFQESLIRGLDLASLNKWISHHKRELQKLEPL